MEFDAEFYLRENPDVAAASVDPLTHWQSNGWREGRDPHPQFDTRFYLARLGGPPADGLDPLTHWLRIGADEGRPTSPPPDPALRAMLRAFDRPEPPVFAHASAATFTAAPLTEHLRAALVARRHLTISVGHDAFAKTVGGVQLVTAAEQLRCTGDHGLHLHLSPATPWLQSRPLDGPAVLLTLSLDAEPIGTATMASLAHALAAIDRPEARIVVHSLLGHRPEEIVALAETLGAPVTVWLHDYATLCEAPQLLRNGYAFCGAPPVASTACAVCVHGPVRADTMARSLALCARAEILAPSEIAREVWARGSDLPVAVSPHGVLDPLTPALSRGRGGQKPSPSGEGGVRGAPRIAFAGTPAFRKGHGWATALMAKHPGHAWFSVGDADDFGSHLPARTSARDPWATARALADASIDLVLVLSPWPETFCLVAHEAMVAGCDVLTLTSSGHAAALVAQTGRGIVFDEVAGVDRWLAESARAWVAARPATPIGFRWNGAVDDDPDPILLDGSNVLTRVDLGPRVWGWSRDAGDGALKLRSRWFVPNWLRPEPYDDRRLGLPVHSIELDGRPLDLASLSGGWHAAERGVRWTDGDATLEVARASKILVRGAAGGTYPARP